MSKKNKKVVLSWPSKDSLNIEFRGVSAATRLNMEGRTKFRSRITKNGKDYFLGTYNDPTDAALAYNKKAKSLFGSENKAKKLKRWNSI